MEIIESLIMQNDHEGNNNDDNDEINIIRVTTTNEANVAIK